ncbi:hypothetical protein [Ornithinimicrobium faecis]|uniref:hypothetical protein n=1 Tax=Ornithinimicrobium faecis TaxID=2934158 RepID=UPI00211971CB|nr:hypothetical protein [Ornithinimicrobium sp. HY1745]
MPFDPQLPFTWRQARDEGIPQRALAGRQYRRLVSGIYVAAAPPGKDGARSRSAIAYIEARAALLVAGPHAFLSHHTAARLYGAIVPDVPVLHASVAPGRRRSRHREVVVHQSRRSPATFRGLRITTPEEVFLDLATHLSLVDLVVLGDSLVKRERTTPERLVTEMQQATGHGIHPARRAAALVRTGVDSPMETRCRLLRVLSGLPELETDVRFYGDRDELLKRLDAGDRPTRTAVEYDGRQHIERKDQWEADIGRRETFENEKWRIVTLVSKDIYVTPGLTVERLAHIFRQRGIHVGPLRDEWQRHFPGRPTAAEAKSA